ncbi:hypothetical protein Tco_1064596 [Tanacetum coccineum]
MLPPITNKPCTKPPTEKQILEIIKTLGYDEDPKAKMTSASTFIDIKLHQPWSAILSVLNRSLTGKDTSWDYARLPVLQILWVGYKYYKIKKDESEKYNVEEEQQVSPIKTGRGKGYMSLGNQEFNVPRKPKKLVVPKKPRTLTVADNIVEETIVVELAKSINMYAAKRGVKLKGIALEDLVVQSLLELRKGTKESRLENSDATRDSLCSETDEEKDDETDDSEDSDMDLSDDEPNKGDDDAAGFGVLVYNKS